MRRSDRAPCSNFTSPAGCDSRPTRTPGFDSSRGARPLAVGKLTPGSSQGRELAHGHVIVHYDVSAAIWPNYIPYVQRLVERSVARKVCELGAGANPMFSLGYAEERQLDYVLVDISAHELAKAPSGYRQVQADASLPTFTLGENFDFVITRMIAEHIADPRTFHQNVYKLLVPGGRAFHLFPTLYSLPFVVNRLLPEQATARLLPIFLADREKDGRQGKFHAHYKWCRGPTKRQMRRFERLGFEIEEYAAYFGHGYFRRIATLQSMENRIAAFLAQHPIPLLTSYAYVVLRKPTG